MTVEAVDATAQLKAVMSATQEPRLTAMLVESLDLKMSAEVAREVALVMMAVIESLHSLTTHDMSVMKVVLVMVMKYHPRRVAVDHVITHFRQLTTYSVSVLHVNAYVLFQGLQIAVSLIVTLLVVLHFGELPNSQKRSSFIHKARTCTWPRESRRRRSSKRCDRRGAAVGRTHSPPQLEQTL